MSAPRIDVDRTTTLAPVRDGRLLPYAGIAFLALGAAVLFGEPSLVALATPFAIALGVGLRRRGPVDVHARFVLFTDRVLEGDSVEGLLEITWDGDCDAHVLIHRLRGLSTPSSGPPSRRAPDTHAIELPIRLTAEHWGRHSVGDVWLKLTLPGGLLSWTGQVLVGPAVRVLPGTERLRRLLRPAQSRTVWGVHGTTRLGEGNEFAELRPYVAGDRLRDLNWAATGRSGRPFVNRHHPEVSGDIIIALEAHDDGSATAARVLTKTARTAWAIASAHMRVNDRVGLVGLSGSTQWLPPAGGRLAQYRLMDALLLMGGEAVDGVTLSRRWVDVPSGALIIAISTLADRYTVDLLTGWRAKGRAVVVAMVDTTSLLDAPESEAEALARRVWGLEIDGRVAKLRSSGITVVRSPVDGAVGPVVSGLRRARRSSVARRI